MQVAVSVAVRANDTIRLLERPFIPQRVWICFCSFPIVQAHNDLPPTPGRMFVCVVFQGYHSIPNYILAGSPGS